MSEEAVYDALALLLPEAYKSLKEVGHPSAASLDAKFRELPSLVATAQERLKRTGVGLEEQELQELFKYGIGALARSHRDGDWRPYLLMSELFYEVRPVKRLFEWITSTVALPSSPTVAELNSIAPFMSARISARLGGQQFLILEKGLVEVSLLREVVDEYARKYSMNVSLVPLGATSEAEGLEGSLDFLFVGSIDGWRLGWHTILTLALYSLKRRGVLALILPLNQREGMKSLLGLFGVPVYPDPKSASRELFEKRFPQTYVNKSSGLVGIVAVKR